MTLFVAIVLYQRLPLNYADLKTLKGGSLDVGIRLRGSELEDLYELKTSMVFMPTE